VILGGMTTSSPGKRSRCGDEYIARDGGITYWHADNHNYREWEREKHWL
jgi:hypothetical protein